jgi:hypothetical protein
VSIHSQVKLDGGGAGLGGARALVAAALVAALIGAGCTDEGRPVQMPIWNYTGDSLVIVHQDDGGGEATLQDSLGRTVVGPHAEGLLLAVDDSGGAWCSSGAFIARTTVWVEARRTASRTTNSPPRSPSQ